MPLESATYLDDLNVSNPAASDTLGQADDHIRMLKSVLKSTFPNIDAAVTATPYDLNQGTVPIGVIAIMFLYPLLISLLFIDLFV